MKKMNCVGNSYCVKQLFTGKLIMHYPDFDICLQCFHICNSEWCIVLLLVLKKSIQSTVYDKASIDPFKTVVLSLSVQVWRRAVSIAFR